MLRGIITFLAAISASSVVAAEKNEHGDLVITEDDINPELKEAISEIEDAPSGSSDDLSDSIKAVISAAKGGRWAMFAGGVMAIVVFIVDKMKFIPNLKEPASSVLSLIVGMIGGVSAWLVMTPQFTIADLLVSIIEGFIAAGGVVIIKQLIKKA